jgi:hypothetical protein
VGVIEVMPMRWTMVGGRVMSGVLMIPGLESERRMNADWRVLMWAMIRRRVGRGGVRPIRRCRRRRRGVISVCAR